MEVHQQQQPGEVVVVKAVRFTDEEPRIRREEDDAVYEDDQRWFSPGNIASFRDETLRTVQAARAFEKEGGGEPLDEEQFCLRGLEQKMLKRPPPNFVKRVLQLQTKQRQMKTKSAAGRKTTSIKMKGDPATSLQLFSEACSKWARKRAQQLAAEDEFVAYQIFKEGLRNRQQRQYDHEVDDDDSYGDDDDEDNEYYGDEEFDFCTESEFVHDVYDYKHDPTEDETEYDDSDVFEPILAVDKNGVEIDPFDMEDEDLLTPVA